VRVSAAVGPELQLGLRRLGAALVLGELKPDATVAIASAVVASGATSDSALELATMPSDPKRLSVFEVEPLARRMLTELGVPIASPPAGGWIMARFVAEAMIAGAIEPPEGARRLWGLWSECGSVPDNELTKMLQLHDDWESSVGAEREAIEVEMLQYAPQVILAADRELAASDDA
jgi:hypothetical protein